MISVAGSLADQQRGADPSRFPHLSVRRFGRSPILLVCVPLLWAIAAVPVPLLKWPVFVGFLAVAALSPAAAALTLATSSLFFATMSMTADLVYALRAFCIGSFVYWWLFILRAPIGREPVAWVAGISALLALGAMSTTAGTGVPFGDVRPAHFEAAVAALWAGGILVGWGWIQARGGRLHATDVMAVAAAWVVSIGYGVAQTAYGITDATVPPDVIPHIEGLRQYEELGRRTFASLTANGMAVASILPLVLMLACCQRSTMVALLALGLGAVVGVLTLTRSFLALLMLLILLLGPLTGVARRTWMLAVASALAGGVLVMASLDPELLGLALRLEGDVSSLRGQIWSFTLENMDPWHWVTGMGSGSGTWQTFLAPISTSKDLASPHSALLEVTGQFGLAGLLAYVAVAFVLVRRFWYLRSTPAAAAPALAGLLILLREQVAASYVFSPSMLAAGFWLIFGMALGARADRSAVPDARTAAP